MIITSLGSLLETKENKLINIFDKKLFRTFYELVICSELR